jgi:hypothetical protein
MLVIAVYAFFIVAGLCVGFLYSPFFEWKLHKDWMHKKRRIKWKWIRTRPLVRRILHSLFNLRTLRRILQKLVNFPFTRHHIIHHGIFAGDHTYHAGPTQDPVTRSENLNTELEKWTIPMAWWQGFALVAIASSPWWIVIWIVPGSNLFTILFGAGITVGLGIYFAIYEYFHWCMHDPQDRWFERTSIYQFMDYHHLNHHKHMGRNFNVVLPIADLLFRTYYRK